ncbi:serine threonine kinase [Fusarium albosuccineum]|uniref:Serine threonine kinase n=1 Tax=Fusarium albosuccineum TaxID=1237068 RepID=A0A8H4L1Q6_9HYPO|nr:serine threonine kinase [Fusarium albosuccineum]
MISHVFPIKRARDDKSESSLEDSPDLRCSTPTESPYKALITSCERRMWYPCNLLQPRRLNSTLKRDRRYLDDNEKKLFNLDFEEIHFHELDDEGDGQVSSPLGHEAWLLTSVHSDFRTQMIRNSPCVRNHLCQNRPDPKCRFIFIQAEHSRAPLNCSRDSFSHILSFHQVPPSFLDFVSSFGSTHYPTDYHMTGFHCDDTLDVPESNLLSISKLGRSGREHRMQYLLRSVERDTGPDGSKRWNIRQMAVHHAYDLSTGKALWINIKANNVMEERIKEATADFPSLGSAAMKDLPKSFAATLATHLIHLEWCDEEWRHCINDAESKIRDALAKAQTARIRQPPQFTPLAQRALAVYKPTVSGLSQQEKFSPLAPRLWGQGIWNRFQNLGRRTNGGAQDPRSSAVNDGYIHDRQIDSLMNLDTFSIEEVQKLHYLGEQLESFRLVMELNCQTLRDIAERYQELLSRRGFPKDIKMGCTEDVESFVRRVARSRKNLEIRITQVKSLITWLQDGKALFDGILQYRNVQISRIFTESSHAQSEKMERIAYKTEKETISMHVITCVTLAFLPAMFVATFFQSGLVEVNQNSTGVNNAVKFHSNAFGLFAGICFPLMADSEFWSLPPPSTVPSFSSLLPLFSYLAAPSGTVISHLTIHSFPRSSPYSCKNQASLPLQLEVNGTTGMTHHQPEVDFRTRVQNVSVTGLNGYFQEVPYVPYSELEKYWTTETLRRFLSSLQINESVEQIRSKFLRIFSILVSIGQPKDITLFLRGNINDEKLPLYKLPDQWLDNVDSVLTEQWKFWPLEFTNGPISMWELPVETILPVKVSKTITREGWISNAAKIYQVEIHDDCKGLVPAGHPVVFKVYEGLDAKKDYTAEAEVYATLGPKSSRSITKCYGSLSYEKTDRRIIILEYAREGSLLDFLKNTERPATIEEFTMLWKRLLELLEGLYALHNVDEPESRIIAGIHQDIQPANILVFPRSNKSRFDVTFKLADFGMAELKKVLTPKGAMAIENEGNRMYSAPECYVNYKIQSEKRPHVNSLADLWAIGAVYSDVLIWSIGGENKRKEYRQKRKNAIAELDHLNESGFDACFHDGINRLPVVDEFHKDVLDDRSRRDFLSPCMSQFILEFMLTDIRYRFQADTAKLHAERKINEARLGCAGPRPGTPVINPTSQSEPQFPPRPGPANHSVTPFNSGDHVSVDKVYAKLEEKGRKLPLTLPLPWKRHRSRQSDTGMELSGMQDARALISTQGGRDQIMLIDNFASMRRHMDRVAMTARVVSYVTKIADKDGMDLYFASDTRKPQKCWSSRAIQSAIKSIETVEGNCHMQKCLDDIMNQVWTNGMKATSIYVFTDGVWDPGDDHGVDMVIRQSINRLVHAGALPTKLMFQFIQFGRNERGTARLKYLDDDCVEMHPLGKYDIVDTKHCDNHVPDIVMGSISSFNDAKPTNATQPWG